MIGGLHVADERARARRVNDLEQLARIWLSIPALDRLDIAKNPAVARRFELQASLLEARLVIPVTALGAGVYSTDCAGQKQHE